MPISDKTRKLLWGRCGNRCAICHHELVINATPADDDSVVAEECHIVSGKKGGPRHDPSFPADQLDEQENLILLCRVHHKMVDDQQDTYTAEDLRRLKANHENWVSAALSAREQAQEPRIRRVKDNIPHYLFRLTSGQDITNIVGEACGFSFEHDEPASKEENEIIGEFLQEAQDWGDLWSGLEAGERVNGTYRMSTLLRNLEENGFWVFGAREVQRLEGGVRTPSPFPVAILRVIRSTSTELISVDLRGKRGRAKA